MTAVTVLYGLLQTENFIVTAITKFKIFYVLKLDINPLIKCPKIVNGAFGPIIR